jgi:nitrite reductase/ring-hydroxylating ferredoxin subunit
MRPFDDLTSLERAEWLDRPAAAVRSVVQRVLRHQGVKDALHGVWLGHPLHPGAAQFALGAFTSAAMLDTLRGSRSASSQLIIAGLAATAPTVASGWADWGDAHEDQQRVGLVHAATNGTAVALFVAALATRARGRSGRLASVAGGVVAGVGAVLGGHMGYRQALGANHAEAVTHIGPAHWKSLGPLADLPENKPVQRRAGAVDVVVVRRGDAVTVLADACSHLAAPLSDGELIDADGDPRLVCPWHGSEFRLADGCVVHGPATASAPRFESRVIDGVVEARVVRIPGVDAAPD